MKPITALLVFSVLLSNCSNNTEDENPKSVESSLLTISISENYFIDRILELGDPKVFITDINGNLISEGNLINGETIELKAIYDINDYYDVTIMIKEKGLGGQVSINFQTFNNVEPYHYVLEKLPNKNPEEKTIDFCINNVGGQLSEITSTGAGGWSNSNGDYKFNYRLNKIPDNFYISFKNSSENFIRYLWLKNVDGEHKDTFMFDSLDKIEDPIIISYPENDFLTVGIEGFLSSDLNRPQSLSYKYQNGGLREMNHFIPKDIFENYTIYTGLRRGKEEYSTVEKTNNIEFNHTIPSMEIDISNPNNLAFEATSPSDFDYFSTEFRYNSPNNDVNIRWSVHGLAQQNIKISLPNLFYNINDELSEFIRDDLTFNSMNLIHHDTAISYTDYICGNIFFNDCASSELFSKRIVYTKR